MAEHRNNQEVIRIRSRLTELETERAALEARLTELLQPSPPPIITGAATVPATTLTAASSAAEKIALFRSLFAGRTDVFPTRWENARNGRSGYAPACAHEWVKGICGKPQIKCGECSNQAFIPVSDDVIASHLRGNDFRGRIDSDFVAGVYPLLFDETCWFLAVDFDGASWAQDAIAYLEACRAKGVPAALERSRSGNGGHIWIFFAEPIPAREARRLGAMLVTETMERRPEIGFQSYDRFFPSQDTMPLGGFGNLIALPLQRNAREHGDSVFVDDELRPYNDQWAFLSSLLRINRERVTSLLEEAETDGRVLGVRMPVEDEAADEPWLMPPSRRRDLLPIHDPLPRHVQIVLADQLYIDRSGLPPGMVARLVRIAAFQNPEFYRAQAMRLSTFGKPRIISCAELHPRHVALPRGCLDEARELLRSHGISSRGRRPTRSWAAAVGTLSWASQ